MRRTLAGKWYTSSFLGRLSQNPDLGLLRKKGAQHGRSFPISIPLACAVLLFATTVAFARGNSPYSQYAGVYMSHLGKGGPFMGLSLGKDGTATLTEDPGKGTATSAMTSFGRWQEADGGIKIIFDATEGVPAEPPMVFDAVHDGLQAATWNRSVWGKLKPPTMKKGYKVKQVYWTTTVPSP